MPTFIDIASETARTPVAPLVGSSLMPLVRGDKPKGWSDTVYGEYLAEGTTEPVFMIKRGTMKLIVAKGDPAQLFDTAKDPHELTNLAGDPVHARARRFQAGRILQSFSQAVARRCAQ